MSVKKRLLKYTKNTEFPNEGGVYILKNIKNKKVYIGCTRDLRARLATHRSLLLGNKHHSSELQAAFNRDVLIVRVLAVLPHANQSLLKEAERIFIQASPHIFPSGIINKRLLNYVNEDD